MEGSEMPNRISKKEKRDAEQGNNPANAMRS
jgi:hypothetical protein